MSGCPFHKPGSDAMPSVMEVLKTSTQSMHDAAEGHAFQQSLVRGEVTREQYAVYLGQLLLVHRALEGELRRHAVALPAIARVVKPEQYQEPYLLEDLAFYGLDVARIVPLASTMALVDEIMSASGRDPLSLLGYHYVMEGSNNGNKFIARAVAKSFGISGHAGLRYLDPYGDQQRVLWTAFKNNMNACGFSPAEMMTLAVAAQGMFRGIGAISAEMSSFSPVAVVAG
ncbi:MAG: biliverdin-producing heme oxygenase [Phycisphaerales bacterium]